MTVSQIAKNKCRNSQQHAYQYPWTVEDSGIQQILQERCHLIAFGETHLFNDEAKLPPR